MSLTTPIIGILYLTYPEAILEVNHHETWAIWIFDTVYAAAIFVNWDYIFGKTAAYFQIRSDKIVKDFAITNTVISSVAVGLITAFYYVQSEDVSTFQ